MLKAVARKLRHLVEDLAGLRLGELALSRTGQKDSALLLHLCRVFLSHGAAQQIGAAQRVAADDIRDLHDLLLVDHDAERLLEQRLELGQRVLDLAASPLALDEVVDHAHGARAIERVERGEMLDGVRLVAPQNVAHAAGFKLEDTRRKRAMEDLLERLLVFERNERKVNGLTAIGLDQASDNHR